MMRDMQVTVVSTSNKAPDIRPLKDSCYIAGTVIEEEVRATDDTYPDDPLSLYASGGPFEVEISPATIEDITAPTSSTLTAGFTWNSGCYHIRKSFYAANFRAKDYHIRPLVDIETWLINITAPAPENLAANTEGRSIILNWDEEYDCDSEDHFQGYIIWRKEGTTEIINSTCEVDLRQYGYQELSKTDSTTFYDSVLNMEVFIAIECRLFLEMVHQHFLIMKFIVSQVTLFVPIYLLTFLFLLM